MFSVKTGVIEQKIFQSHQILVKVFFFCQIAVTVQQYFGTVKYLYLVGYLILVILEVKAKRANI